MPLSKYQKRRNFKKTPEPAGGKITKHKKAIFVVQEHHATHLHYDLRLEINGVLASWAIPKGPSLNPSEKRLAVQTEDHPLEYAKFAGTIPEGEYGAGTVKIWDSGTWEMDGDSETAFKQGKIEFRLFGKKLHGTWVLIRFKNDPKNWLLKKTIKN